MQDLTITQWKEQIAQDDSAVIIDVRTEEETENGIIEGAHIIDIHQGQGFIDEVNKLNKDKSYYVYCRSGGRSAQACALMEQMGFTDTFNLLGGYTAWNEMHS